MENDARVSKDNNGFKEDALRKAGRASFLAWRRLQRPVLSSVRAFTHTLLLLLHCFRKLFLKFFNIIPLRGGVSLIASWAVHLLSQGGASIEG